MERLTIDSTYPYSHHTRVAPSFWAALPSCLPRLRALNLIEWHHREQPDSVTALSAFIRAHKGQQLSIQVSPELRAALGLPPADGYWVHLPLAC